MTWFSWKLPILSEPNYFRWPFFLKYPVLGVSFFYIDFCWYKFEDYFDFFQNFECQLYWSCLLACEFLNRLFVIDQCGLCYCTCSFAYILSAFYLVDFASVCVLVLRIWFYINFLGWFGLCCSLNCCWFVFCQTLSEQHEVQQHFMFFFFSCRWRFSNWLMQLKQCSRCFQYTFFSHLQS